MFRLIIFLVNAICIYSFLLDTNKPQNAVGQTNAQYLTLSEYVEDKTQREHEVERMFRILTSQLQQKLGEFENKLMQNSQKNVTENLEETWEKKYHDLELKYAKLQTNFDQINAKLLLHEQSLSRLDGKTTDLESKTSHLEGLKQIQYLQDISQFQNKLQSIDASVTSLRSNEQARNQDFMALYNQTIVTKHQAELQQDMTNRQIEMLSNSTTKQLNNLAETLTKYFNNTVEDVVNTLHAIKANESIEINKIKNDIERIKNKVSTSLPSFFATLTNTAAFSNTVVKFDNVLTNIGQGYNAATGVFTAPTTGVYEFSVNFISSNSDYLELNLYKNQQLISRGYSKLSNDAGSIRAIVELSKGGRVFVKNPRSSGDIIGSKYSMFSGHML